MTSATQEPRTTDIRKRIVLARFFSRYSDTAGHVALIAIAISAFASYYGYIAYGNPVKWLHLFFADDTFYYLKIAENAARYGFFTFDGIHYTNGFQPLWMVVLVALKQCIGNRDLLVATLYLCMLLHCVNSVLFGQLIRLLTGSVIWSLASQLLFLSNTLLMKANFLLMENTLAMTLIVMLFIRVPTRRFLSVRPAPSQSIINGCLLAALALTRIDYVLIVAALGMTTIFLRRRIISQEMLMTYTPSIAALLILALVNLAYFGNPGLISGHVKHNVYVAGYLSDKHGWERMGVYLDSTINLIRTLQLLTFQGIAEYISQHLDALGIGTACVTIATAAAHFLLRRTRSKNVPRSGSTLSILALCACAILHAAAMVYYLPVFIFGSQWYFSLETVAVIAAAIYVFSRASARLELKGVGLLAATLACQASIATASQIGYEAKVWQPSPTSDRSLTYAMARYIDETLPQDAIVGSFNAGIIGYYSNRRVVNLDGLVNDFEYYRRVLSRPAPPDALQSYLKDSLVHYLVDYQACTTCSDDEILDNAVLQSRVSRAHLTLLKATRSDQQVPVRNVANEIIAGRSASILVYLLKVTP